MYEAAGPRVAKTANPAPSATFDTGGLSGLTEREAVERLAAAGPNALPSEEPRGNLAIVVEVVRQPMLLMLVAAGTLYLSMGQPRDALLLLLFVGVVIGITVVQERRTERALEALRDGVARRISGRDVVPGDQVMIAEGDRVPADSLLRRSAHLAVDESLLTGESVPVRKVSSATAVALDPPGGDGLPSLYSGTLVVAGQGVCEVVRTGPSTELGRIGRRLSELEPERTPLQAETDRIVRILATAGLTTCLVVVVSYALSRGNDGGAWRDGLLAGITMAMAILPEEFPVVLTVFLALGAWRLSRRRVLTRRLAAIETLGAATVLCVDKTGTLTENRMTVAAVATNGRTLAISSETRSVPDEVSELIAAARFASRSDPFDPTERALHDAHARFRSGADEPGRLVREYPLTPALLVMSQAWQAEHAQTCLVASKGAPEAIARLCVLSSQEETSVLAQAAAMGRDGLRVLAIAAARWPSSALPVEQVGLRPHFVGLVGLADPLREHVPSAVTECRAAGVRVVMITGDYPETARSIAQIGRAHV